MDSQTDTVQTSPPRIIASVVAGFNTIASHAYLIIFPVALDLLLWFGPHLRIKTLFQPLVDNLFIQLANSNLLDAQALAQAATDLKQTGLDPINLMAAMRSWPIGIPSLFTFDGIVQTPFGRPTFVELPTMLIALVVLILVVLTGTYAGCIFYNAISNASLGLHKPFSFSLSLWQFKQSLFLTLLLFILMILIALPISFILVLFSLFQLVLFGYLIVIFILFWILLPLVFSAHGIFMFKLNTVPAIATSVRLVRSFLPGTWVFLLTAFLLNEGMNALWRTPPADSWMRLIGVAGHAFIASGLLAASFVYYGAGMRWMQENLQHMATQQSRA